MGSGPTRWSVKWCRAMSSACAWATFVPADARLLAGGPVEVDQCALTGESLPAERKPSEAVFSGSIMRRGEIEAMVLRHRCEPLLRQDRATGRGGAHRQSFPACRAELGCL